MDLLEVRNGVEAELRNSIAAFYGLLESRNGGRKILSSSKASGQQPLTFQLGKAAKNPDARETTYLNFCFSSWRYLRPMTSLGNSSSPPPPPGSSDVAVSVGGPSTVVSGSIPAVGSPSSTVDNPKTHVVSKSAAVDDDEIVKVEKVSPVSRRGIRSVVCNCLL